MSGTLPDITVRPQPQQGGNTGGGGNDLFNIPPILQGPLQGFDPNGNPTGGGTNNSGAGNPLLGPFPGAGGGTGGGTDPFTGNQTNPGATNTPGGAGQLGDPTGGDVTGGGGFGTLLGGSGTQSTMTWLEELAIRIMLMIVGLVLIAGGFHIAAARGVFASATPAQLATRAGLPLPTTRRALR